MKAQLAALALLPSLLALPARAAEAPPVTGEIVFTRFDGHQTDLYRMAADSAQPVLVYKGTDPVNGSAMAPRWSADRARILFTARRDGGWKLLSSDRDGGDIKVEPGPSAFDAPPQPAGTDGLALHAGDLFYTPPDGKPIKLYDFHAVLPKPVPEDAGGAKDVAWGPGHRWIIFSSCGERQFAKAIEPCQLYIVTPDGSSRKHLGPGEAPDWQAAGP
jgi:hypothetical protein